MEIDFETIARADPRSSPPGEALGFSREGRPVIGHRFGSGDFRVNLIAGCHADEPVGPLLLRKLVARLAALPPECAALADFEWWIVPHANPDGAERNRAWTDAIGDTIDPVAYVRHAERELPGDDVEFGFPRDARDRGVRPENRAISDWWRRAAGPFRLHASLHGMAVAHGPWFLIEAAWKDRSARLQERCRSEVAALGYELHDVDRRGEKGFVRIGPGFTTRPDSKAMASFFRDKGDERTAALFRPSSMETIRALGGDPLTLVSEMPLLLLPPRETGEPATSEDLGRWKQRLGDWKLRLARGESPDEIRRDVAAAGIVPMPLVDQMRLQWTFARAGLEQVLESA